MTKWNVHSLLCVSINLYNWKENRRGSADGPGEFDKLICLSDTPKRGHTLNFINLKNQFPVPIVTTFRINVNLCQDHLSIFNGLSIRRASTRTWTFYVPFFFVFEVSKSCIMNLPFHNREETQMYGIQCLKGPPPTFCGNSQNSMPIFLDTVSLLPEMFPSA